MIIKKMVIGGVKIEDDEEEKEPMPSFLMF